MIFYSLSIKIERDLDLDFRSGYFNQVKKWIDLLFFENDDFLNGLVSGGGELDIWSFSDWSMLGHLTASFTGVVSSLSPAQSAYSIGD